MSQTLPMPLGVTAVMLAELDFAQQLALCQSLGVTHYTLRPRIIRPEAVGKPYSSHGNHKFDLTPQRLIKEAKSLRKQMDDAGITPFGTVPQAGLNNTDDELKVHFEGSAAVGAGRVRVQPEGYPKEHFNYPEFLNRTVEGYARAIKAAKPFGQKIVIETHCGCFATSPALAWNICRNFSPDEIGVIFDISNFNIEGSLRPNLAVAVLDQYIDHVHIGGVNSTTGEYDELGFRKRGTQMGMLTEANLYIPDWVRALHNAGRDVPLIIETFVPATPGGLLLTIAAEALTRLLKTL